MWVFGTIIWSLVLLKKGIVNTDTSRDVTFTIVDELSIQGIPYAKYELEILEYSNTSLYRINSTMSWCPKDLQTHKKTSNMTANTISMFYPKDFIYFIIHIEEMSINATSFSIYGSFKVDQSVHQARCEGENLVLNYTVNAKNGITLYWGNHTYDTYHVILRDSKGIITFYDQINKSSYKISNLKKIFNISIVPYKDGFGFYQMAVSIAEMEVFYNFFQYVDRTNYIGTYTVNTYKIQRNQLLESSFITVDEKKFSLDLEDERKYVVMVVQTEYPRSLVAYKHFKFTPLTKISNVDVKLEENCTLTIAFDLPSYDKHIDYYKLEMKELTTNYLETRLFRRNPYSLENILRTPREVFFLNVLPVKNNKELVKFRSEAQVLQLSILNGTLTLNMNAKELATAICPTTNNNLD